jgi:hypothetical protein
MQQATARDHLRGRHRRVRALTLAAMRDDSIGPWILGAVMGLLNLFGLFLANAAG